MADEAKWSDGTAKGFNARFFRSASGTTWKIRWYDQMGVVQLGKILAEIQIGKGDDYKCYFGYLVTLRSKTKGEIARHCFRFDEYLGRKYEVTTNNPRDEFAWRDAPPPDEMVDRMASEILCYISEYGS